MVFRSPSRHPGIVSFMQTRRDARGILLPIKQSELLYWRPPRTLRLACSGSAVRLQTGIPTMIDTQAASAAEPHGTAQDELDPLQAHFHSGIAPDEIEQVFHLKKAQPMLSAFSALFHGSQDGVLVRLLVLRDAQAADVAHLAVLAEETQVPVEIDPALPYQAVSLIRSASDA